MDGPGLRAARAVRRAGDLRPLQRRRDVLFRQGRRRGEPQDGRARARLVQRLVRVALRAPEGGLPLRLREPESRSLALRLGLRRERARAHAARVLERAGDLRLLVRRAGRPHGFDAARALFLGGRRLRGRQRTRQRAAAARLRAQPHGGDPRRTRFRIRARPSAARSASSSTIANRLPQSCTRYTGWSATTRSWAASTSRGSRTCSPRSPRRSATRRTSATASPRWVPTTRRATASSPSRAPRIRTACARAWCSSPHASAGCSPRPSTTSSPRW